MPPIIEDFAGYEEALAPHGNREIPSRPYISTGRRGIVASEPVDDGTLGVAFAMVIILCVIIMVTLFSSICIIKPDQEGVLSILGRYSRTLRSGLHFVPPFISKVRMVEVGYQPIDLPDREYRTADDFRVELDLFVSLDVEDAAKAVLNTTDYKKSSMHEVELAMGTVVTGTDLPDLMEMEPDLTSELRPTLDEATKPFGVVIRKVNVRDLRPDERGEKFLRDLAATSATGGVGAKIAIAEGTPAFHRSGLWMDKREDNIARVREALDFLPSGLPQPLWGWHVDDLAVAIVDGKKRQSSTGTPLVEIEGVWYVADPSDIALFLKEWREE